MRKYLGLMDRAPRGSGHASTDLLVSQEGVGRVMHNSYNFNYFHINSVNEDYV